MKGLEGARRTACGQAAKGSCAATPTSLPRLESFGIIKTQSSCYRLARIERGEEVPGGPGKPADIAAIMLPRLRQARDPAEHAAINASRRWRRIRTFP
jgi:hypothetical protein